MNRGQSLNVVSTVRKSDCDEGHFQVREMGGICSRVRNINNVNEVEHCQSLNATLKEILVLLCGTLCRIQNHKEVS